MIRAVALDMDGVLKVGLTAIPRADDTVKELLRRGYKLMVVTNECRWTPEQIAEMLHRIGLPTAARLPVYTASLSVRDFLLTRPVRKVSVIGSHDLRSMVDPIADANAEHGEHYLVMGTMETVSEEDTEFGARLIREGCQVVLTCTDRLDPSRFTIKMPRDVFESCTEGLPDVAGEVHCVGKPHPIVIDGVVRTLQEPADRVLFVGDTMDTDIKIAKVAGFKSALVLSGNTSVEQLSTFDFAPDYVLQDITGLLDLLPPL